MEKVLCSDPIDAGAAAFLRSHGHVVLESGGMSREELLDTIGEYDGLIVRR